MKRPDQRRAVAVLLALAAFGACSRGPDEPSFDNPFDPRGTNPGGGYGLTAVAQGSAVTLSWDNLAGVIGYSVLWSPDSPDSADMMRITPADSLLPPSLTPRIVYRHEGFVAEKTNWYRVVGVTAVAVEGGIPLRTSMLASDPVGVDIHVLVEPVGGVLSTPSREIEIDLLTGVADSVELSNQNSFASSSIFEVTPAVPSRVGWTLPAVATNRTDLWVHFRTRMSGSIGTADSFAIQARFDPQLDFERGVRTAPGGAVMVDTLQIYTIAPFPGQSVESVIRHGHALADSSAFVRDITPASVDDPVIVHWDPAVEAAVNGSVVATLSCDFGFSVVDSVVLRVPGAIGPAAVSIVGGAFTTTRDIQVRNIAVNAGYILLSEQPDFSGGTWVTWADTLAYQLENVLGSRDLFAAYSNPILASTVVTSTPVTLVNPPRH